ncbi:hypothetical protein [Vibrio sp. TRT 17S01]|uniref:hypothetical protein n=1 Tax=Vibrio sp. TRT 17S01 TaxID=3418505 RepID=UPI003CF821C9
MSSIIFGTTNTSGHGSSANLNEDNGFVVNSDDYYHPVGVSAHQWTSEDGREHIEISADIWNNWHTKEVKIESSVTDITVSNFVDFDITNTTDEDTYITVTDAKRGSIDTSGGSSNDVITIGVNPHLNQYDNIWPSNQHGFNIKTGDGNDIVTLNDTSPEGSLYGTERTIFNIDLGAGNDIFINEMDASGGGPQEVHPEEYRHADGGEGLDVYVPPTGGNFWTDGGISGFEVITDFDESQDSVFMLKDLSDWGEFESEYGLVCTGVTVVELNMDVPYAQEINDGQAAYLESLGLDSSQFDAYWFGDSCILSDTEVLDHLPN